MHALLRVNVAHRPRRAPRHRAAHVDEPRPERLLQRERHRALERADPRGRGHLGAGAGGDITVYTEQEDQEAMFAKPDYVFKDGELVVKHGEVVKIVWGNVHTVKPEFDRGAVEKDLKEYYDRYLTMKLDNFIIHNDEIEGDGRSKIIVHPCART